MRIQFLLPLFLFLSSCHLPSCQKEMAPAANTRDKIVFKDGSSFHSGYKPRPREEYLKVEPAKMTRSFSEDETKPYKNLPRSVDLSAQLPHPGDQGEQNSCTGWAVAYAVKSFQEHRELGWAFNEKHLFSPAFLYNQLNSGEDGGARLDDVIKLLIYEGASHGDKFKGKNESRFDGSTSSRKSADPKICRTRMESNPTTNPNPLLHLQRFHDLPNPADLQRIKGPTRMA